MPLKTVGNHAVLSSERCTSWYLAYTKSKAEEQALDNLRNQNYDAWAPQIKSVQKRVSKAAAEAGVPTFTLLFMFPRYVFFRPSSEQHSIGPVQSTAGVSKIVRFGHQPALLSHENLVHIAQWVQRQHQQGTADILGVRPGQQVQLTQGPFAGLDAVVKMTAQERVIVLLELLGKDHTVALPYTALVPA